MKTGSLVRKETGFTFVELLVVLALTGIITAGLVNFMISQSRSYNLQEDVQEMEQNARIAMDFFAKKVRTANKIKIFDPYDPANNDGTKIKLITFTMPGMPGETYYFKFCGSDPTDDAVAERIGQTTTNVAYFLQDLDHNEKLDFPVFQQVIPGVITITIEARTRRRDPNYPNNGGYRRILLSRQVVARSIT